MHQNGRTICVFSLCFLAFLMLHRIEPILSGDTKTICEGLCVTLWKKNHKQSRICKAAYVLCSRWHKFHRCEC